MSNKVVNGVSTFLWDTTYTTSYEVVNNKIKELATYPATFNNTVNARELFDYISPNNEQSYFNVFLKNSVYANANAEVSFSGKWNKWELFLRGNGNTIYLKLPIISGEIALINSGIVVDKDDTALDNGYLIVEVQLAIEGQTANKKTLALTDNEFSQVVVVDHNFPNIDKKSIWDLVIDGAFKRYFNTEKILKQFRYVFSTVNINDKATGDFAWLKPSDIGYAVFVPNSGATMPKSLFSILCMTENAKAPSYIQQSVDGSVFTGITADANAVLCISPQKFCKNFLIAAAKNMIKDSVDSDYSYSTDGTGMENAKQIVWKNVEVGNNKIVDLTIKPLNFTINIKNDHLDLKISNATFHETMYDAYLTLEQRIEFNTKTVNGKTIFIPKDGDKFKGTIHTIIEPTETAEVLKWVGVAIDILAGLLFVAGGVAKIAAKVATTATRVSATITDVAVSAAEVSAATAAAGEAIGAGSKVTKALLISNRLWVASSACFAIGLPFSLCGTIAAAIAKGDFSKVPPLEDFAQNFLSNIQWTGIEKTTLKGARLNDAFLLDFKIE